MTRRVLVRGVVQGVGFRPYLARQARRLGLAGWTRNGPGWVEAVVEGAPDAVEVFLDAARRGPEGAAVRGVEVSEGDAVAGHEAAGPGFVVRESAVEGMGLRGLALPPDQAPCAACREEVLAPGGRRSGYPFTSCASCGPRLAVVTGWPYDRERTTMAPFPMCGACRSEYADPEDRRFHAQTIACPDCGPELAWDGGSEDERGPAALEAAVAALRSGELVAVLGVSGFQLLADACDASAVAAVRAVKCRPSKPLAVLVEDAGVLGRYAVLDNAEGVGAAPASTEAGGAAAAPVLLLPAREGSGLSPGLAPGRDEIGVMLPPSPLHLLLVRGVGRPLVCTSANRSGEPLAVTLEEARAALGDAVAGYLTHDRAVARPLDDAVVRPVAGRVRVLRIGRGVAPTALPSPATTRCVLALGARQKAAPALAVPGWILPGAHVGDLGTMAAEARLEARARDLLARVGATPERIACDEHPDYESSRLASRLAHELRVPLVKVQHHHAHVAAVLAERGHEGPVLGLAWDGAGYGRDGTTWGGEVLAVDGATFQRLGHLRPLVLPGGDRAARSPRRMALAALAELDEEATDAWRREAWGDAPEGLALARLARSPRAPRASSVGRLLDAVAALLGVCREADHEGQAAAELEVLARRGRPGAGPSLGPGGDWRELVRAVWGGRDRPEDLARAAHDALVDWAAAEAAAAGHETVVLAGGCFQSRLLSEGCLERLEAAGHRVLLAEAVPCHDGGVAVGQAWVAARSEGS